jgi:hypothetical protein
MPAGSAGWLHLSLTVSVSQFINCQLERRRRRGSRIGIRSVRDEPAPASLVASPEAALSDMFR